MAAEVGRSLRRALGRVMIAAEIREYWGENEGAEVSWSDMQVRMARQSFRQLVPVVHEWRGMRFYNRADVMRYTHEMEAWRKTKGVEHGDNGGAAEGEA